MPIGAIFRMVRVEIFLPTAADLRRAASAEAASAEAEAAAVAAVRVEDFNSYKL